MNPPLNPPITESDLQAFVDGQLTLERQREVQAYLDGRPDEAQRVAVYRAQKRELRALFDPVLDEALPPRLLQRAQPRVPWFRQSLAAGIVIAAVSLVSGAGGWALRGAQAPQAVVMIPAATGFAQRAAVAHAVYSPEQRRPVEVDAAHQDQLVTWLSKRMGAPMKAPHLQEVGYALEGGRLLPGRQGPVAQFMYRDEAGARLTLYVSSEISDLAAPPGASAATNAETAFRFAQEGPLNVFYWVDGPWGYAISAGADRAVLARVSSEVYRQLGSERR